MTFKWGLLTFLAARKFRRSYYEVDPQSRGLTSTEHINYADDN